jgi:hypothetical protein
MKITTKPSNGALNTPPNKTLPTFRNLWSKLSQVFGKNSRRRTHAVQPLLALRFTDDREK